MALVLVESCNMPTKKLKSNNILNSSNDCEIGICNSEKNKVQFKSADIFFTQENLSIVGPIGYLNYLKNFSCYELQIPSCRFPKNWVKLDNLTELKLLVDDTTPCPKIFVPSEKSYTLNLDSAYINSSSIGKESKKLINSYYVKYYPCL